MLFFTHSATRGNQADLDISTNMNRGGGNAASHRGKTSTNGFSTSTMASPCSEIQVDSRPQDWYTSLTPRFLHTNVQSAQNLVMLRRWAVLTVRYQRTMATVGSDSLVPAQWLVEFQVDLQLMWALLLV